MACDPLHSLTKVSCHFESIRTQMSGNKCHRTQRALFPNRHVEGCVVYSRDVQVPETFIIIRGVTVRLPISEG